MVEQQDVQGMSVREAKGKIEAHAEEYEDHGEEDGDRYDESYSINS